MDIEIRAKRSPKGRYYYRITSARRPIYQEDRNTKTLADVEFIPNTSGKSSLLGTIGWVKAAKECNFTIPAMLKTFKTLPITKDNVNPNLKRKLVITIRSKKLIKLLMNNETREIGEEILRNHLLNSTL